MSDMVLRIRRGNDYTNGRELVLMWTDPDTNEPIDLSGATGWFVVKRRRTDADADALIFKTTADDMVPDPDQTEEGNRGRCTVAIAGSDTEDTVPGSAYYAAQMRDVDDRIFEVGWERIEIEGDLIQATTVPS